MTVGMEGILLFGLIALWGVVLLNLLLTIRVVSWLRGVADVQKREAESENLPELPIGEPAPDFRANGLSGEPIRLADFAGTSTAFVFLSPQCETCQRELATLIKLGPLAKKRAGVEVVVVSVEGTAETDAWVRAIRHSLGAEVNLPVLIAPSHSSEFLRTYNPRVFVPYFCYVNGQGIVQARGHLDEVEWSRLKREWESASATAPSVRSVRRYR